MNIAIFTDNQTAFDQATTAWVARLPECISFSPLAPPPLTLHSFLVVVSLISFLSWLETSTWLQTAPSPTAMALRTTIGYVMLCFVLFCFVLFCFVLFCFVLFCFVLFCFVLFCFVLFCFVLFCFVLFCFVLFCFVSCSHIVSFVSSALTYI